MTELRKDKSKTRIKSSLPFLFQQQSVSIVCVHVELRKCTTCEWSTFPNSNLKNAKYLFNLSRAIIVKIPESDL